METKSWHRHYDYNVPHTVRYPRVPLGDLLQLPANNYPDKPALIFHGREITFWQLRTEVLRMANALAGIGVRQGDRVGIHLHTSPQYVIAYYGILSLGAVAVNLNPMYTAGELKHIVQDAGITALFTSDLVLPAVRALCREVEIPRVIVTRIADFFPGSAPTPQGLDLEKGWFYFSRLLEDCSNTRRPRVQIRPEDPALIQFTGGTTGIPKGAVLTHANMVAAAFQCSLWGAALIELTPPERRNVLAVLPYSHVYGNVVVMNTSFLNCYTQILVERFQIDEVMDLLAGFEKITFFPAVPTMISALIHHPRTAEVNLDRKLGLLNSGGAPMPVELIEEVKDMGIFFGEGWGMSESAALGISNPILGLKKAGSIGIPFIDTDVRLVDLSDGVTEVPRGEHGEIVIRSPLVMREYWNNPRETAGQLRDGWLYTGDIAVRDEDDYFFITDRKKDMIIAGGYNIYPREIDEVLYQHPKIFQAIAVGIPDAYRGETVKAFVVLRPGETATDREIIAFCREKLAAYKVPKSVEFRNALPQSGVGKILRTVLRAEEEQKKSGGK